MYKKKDKQLDYAELEDTDTSLVEDAKLGERVESRLPDYSWEKSMEKLNHAPYIVMIGARFSGKSHGIPELVFNLVFVLISFASILAPFAATLPYEVEFPELFPGFAVPMHFFPALAWFTLRPAFFKNQLNEA